MSILKYLDIIDIKFKFYTENQPIHRSVFGGIMTISFLLISFFALMYFEQDEFFKLKPISSMSEITYPYKNIKKSLGKEKIWIPFRIVTYEGEYIDHRNILYPIIYLVEGKNSDRGEMELKYTKLNYKLCNETNMVNKSKNYIIDVDLNELYCIDDKYDIIGGSWGKKEIDYIEINLYLCKNGINYDELNPQCTKFNDLLKYHNTSWLFEFYYPIVQYQPLNIKEPIDVVYRSYYYRLSSYAGKVERIYLRENILSDDQNIIGNNPKNSSYWGMSNIYGDSYFLPTITDPLVKSTSSRLYSLVINQDQGIVYYTRSYKKILDILSEIFPILNIIFLIFQKFTEKVKMSFVKRNLMELLFEKKFLFNMGPNNNIKKTITLAKLSKAKCFYNCLQQRFPIKLKQNSDKKINKNDNFVLNNNDDVVNERSSQNMKMNNKPIVNSLNKLSLFSNYIINKEEDNNNKKIQKKGIEAKKSLNINLYNKKLFPIYYYFVDSILDRLIKPKKFMNVSEKYLIAYNFMNQLYDISTYILLYKQFQLLKTSLNKEENKILNEHTRMNINNNEFMKNLDNDLRFRKFPVFSEIIFTNS